ncbi:MAG: type II toxin-antitoxin system VapC family toxin [Gammaproteobacteria bacterium]
MIVVVDASVAAKWYLDEPYGDAARSLVTSGADLIAPDLILAEFANLTWKRLSRREITEQQATAMVDHLPYMFLHIVPCLALRKPALSIAVALDHPVYDCFYIALAAERNINLVTADMRLIHRVRGTPWEKKVIHIMSALPAATP